MPQPEPRLPRGSAKAAADAMVKHYDVHPDFAKYLANVALEAARAVIERAVLKHAAQQIETLHALARGHLCPACHGKPTVIPTPANGLKTYTCGCGRQWEPPGYRSIDYGMDFQPLIRRLARGESLPGLPPKETPDA